VLTMSVLGERLRAERKLCSACRSLLSPTMKLGLPRICANDKNVCENGQATANMPLRMSTLITACASHGLGDKPSHDIYLAQPGRHLSV